ncbi:hypothetical protein MTO96_020539 [Rhipicephalus appendiculatus]
MTLFHFGNCVALAYVPYLLTYKYSGLSEYGAFWKCVQAAAMYIVMQLCKMLILATFFPPGDVSSVGGFDVLGEFLKATVDLADPCGPAHSDDQGRWQGRDQVLGCWSGMG